MSDERQPAAASEVPGVLCREAFAEAENSMMDTIDTASAFFKDIASRTARGVFENVVITGEGSSYTAALMCEAALKRSIPVATEIILTTELAFWPHLLGPKTLVVVLSRTGERRFIIDAVRQVKLTGAHVVVLTGNPGARLNDLASDVLLTQEGAEPGFLKSKSTLSGIAAFLALAAAFETTQVTGGIGLRLEHVRRVAACVGQGFRMMSGADLTWLQKARSIEHWAVLAGGYGYGTAADGALKLHEITTASATPYHLTSLFHGPLGQFSADWAAIVLATEGTQSWADLVAGELTARGVDPVVYIGSDRVYCTAEGVVALQVPALFESDAQAERALTEALSPSTFLPAIYTITIELALARGLNPDAPPNMEYMLKLILPDGQAEPDFIART